MIDLSNRIIGKLWFHWTEPLVGIQRIGRYEYRKDSCRYSIKIIFSTRYLFIPTQISGFCLSILFQYTYRFWYTNQTLIYKVTRSPPDWICNSIRRVTIIFFSRCLWLCASIILHKSSTNKKKKVMRLHQNLLYIPWRWLILYISARTHKHI